jgi:HAD superfamily hydrolase (TIGR01509 family)
VTTLRAVTFDYWHTLVAEHPGTMRGRQLDEWSRLLAEGGHERDRADLETSFAKNWQRFEEHWWSNSGQYTPTDSVDFILQGLSVQATHRLRAELIDAYRVVGEAVELEVAPGLQTCLRALRAAGVRLGIVCDVGLTSSPTLRDRLAGVGVLDSFDAWSFSDETGVFKPAPEAFRAALDPLGVDPRDAAHIGDNERTDIAGANALGMVSIRYQGLLRVTGLLDEIHFDGLADHVVDDLATLPNVLQVA